ncbi:MAG: penicillin acylase family protein [Silvibacterium sp.]|nr:penicillin acylase family protein [Silvibacterium sp.]
MRKTLLLAFFCIITSFALIAQQAPDADQVRWKAEAARVIIVRDDWGIAHVHGATDADAVFGMIYAQCEDDFHRVETNYLIALGRRAEADGEPALWQDLRQRLFIDPEELKRDYAASPDWLRKLMDAWADGINYYLARHPETKPEVLTRFEPWMALSFTEGSIGGDIERVDLKRLQAFYDTSRTQPASAVPWQLRPQAAQEWMELPPSASNGIAIAPSNTRDHHALLLINPHTSFFFRSELQMSSDEGLNVYGAVTWGQFFIYQGFNSRAGWMHTSSGVDTVDEYRETVIRDGGRLAYRYGNEIKPFTSREIKLQFKARDGLHSRTFAALYTLHGPVIARDGDSFLTIQLMNTPIPALEQSYLRNKARSYADYLKTMDLHANSSNNTVFADADGDIAYWQGNFIPRRDPRFDYTRPVDGSNPATNWQGLLPVKETPHLLNPKSGYLFNVNDSPWNAAGPASLRKSDYPAYVEQGIESARGIHAIQLLSPNGTPRRDFTLDSLVEAAYDPSLPWFARTVPVLVKAYDALPPDAALKTRLSEQIKLLRAWDDRWDVNSVETALAIFWGTELMKTNGRLARQAKVPSEEWVATRVSPDDLLKALAIASAQLSNAFGTWRTPWGQINRFQRLTDEIAPAFTDDGPSIPIGFVYSAWGSLASFASRAYPGTKRWYGSDGNTFVAVVEFGDKVRARGITPGGASGNPQSPHFNDQAQRYADGNLREIYFYPEQIKAHTERTYHPNE